MWSLCMEKGALRCGADHPFLPAPFLGLSLSEAKKLSSYFHFREPVELKNKTLLEKADLDPSLDFMDSLEHDIPKGNSLLSLRTLAPPPGQSSGQCYLPFPSESRAQGLGRNWSFTLGP